MKRTSITGASALALLCSGVSGANPESLTVDRVLANVREATGVLAWTSKPGAVRLAGTGRFLGSEATTEGIVDSEGRFVFRQDGEIDMANSFDGEIVWRLDFGGEAYPLVLGEREQMLFGGYAMTHLWFDPRFGMRFTLSSQPARGEDAPVVLGFTLDGWLLDGTVEIDPNTWLPVRWLTEADESVWTLDGAVECGGATFPASASQTLPSGGQGIYRFSRAERVAEVDPKTFALGPWTPDDSRFDPAVPAQLEAKRALTGHVLVRPLIDGQDVGWFIFDTGAGINVIDTGAAVKLQCREVGSVPAVGAAGTVTSPMLRAKTMTLGPLTTDGPLFIGLEVAQYSAVMGENIAGVIGFPVIWRSVTEFDAETGSVALHDPAKRDDLGVEWSPLTVYNRHSCLPAKFDGHEGVFLLDTGAGSSTVIFHAPTVERLKLLEGRKTSDSMLGGVGGMRAAKAGTIERFELAGERFENLDVRFAVDAEGAMSDAYLVGNIGGGMINGRVLFVDYQNGGFALVKRE